MRGIGTWEQNLSPGSSNRHFHLITAKPPSHICCIFSSRFQLCRIETKGAKSEVWHAHLRLWFVNVHSPQYARETNTSPQLNCFVPLHPVLGFTERCQWFLDSWATMRSLHLKRQVSRLLLRILRTNDLLWGVREISSCLHHHCLRCLYTSPRTSKRSSRPDIRQY